MEQKKKNKSSAKQIKVFATDLYEYVWTKHKFCSSYLEKKFAEQLSLKFLEADDKEDSPFNEDIGKAVLCSMYLLRDITSRFFNRMEKNMTLSQNSFIYCVYLTQYICREFRSDIFSKFIDACAIIGDAFLFCDAKSNSNRELYEAPEMLASLFELQMSKDFFASGGWSQLQKHVLDKYSSVYSFLSIYIAKFDNSYETLPHDCKLTSFLRDSPIMFPVHISKMCGKCILETDEDACFCLDTQYPVEEFLAEYSLELPSLEENKFQDVLSGKEISAENASFLTNSKSYIFLGGKATVETINVNDKKKMFKKRKRRSGTP